MYNTREKFSWDRRAHVSFRTSKKAEKSKDIHKHKHKHKHTNTQTHKHTNTNTNTHNTKKQHENDAAVSKHFCFSDFFLNICSNVDKYSKKHFCKNDFFKVNIIICFFFFVCVCVEKANYRHYYEANF